MANLFDLTGKRALISGASRGIGLACAQALHEAGAEVFLVARNAKLLDEAVRELGSRAHAVPCDITDAAAFRKAIAPLPALDILMCNAGIDVYAPFPDITEAQFDEVVALNLRGTYFVAQAVAHKMIAAKTPGSIILMSSEMGHAAAPSLSVYIMTKHGLEGLTKAMALDLAPHGIRVNAVAPTLTDTPMVRDVLDNPAFAKALIDRIPLGRVGQTNDIVGAVVYLASDAAAFVTGASIKVDGGVTAKAS
jgi:NAD(P)-dependent dehydrogenase (short-subunit alcohol dehydrogenase family)